MGKFWKIQRKQNMEEEEKKRVKSYVRISFNPKLSEFRRENLFRKQMRDVRQEIVGPLR